MAAAKFTQQNNLNLRKKIHREQSREVTGEFLCLTRWKHLREAELICVQAKLQQRDTNEVKYIFNRFYIEIWLHSIMNLHYYMLYIYIQMDI